MSIYLDRGFTSLNKSGEPLCGDTYMLAEKDGVFTAVLSDGMGSGVKANILSTLTARILSTMMASHMSMEECVQTMVKTLPVCRVRHLAYSTFTILQARPSQAETDAMEVYLVQFDNPIAILLRDGVSIPYETSERVIGDKTILESRFTMYPDDMLFLMSDGVSSAGIGKTVHGGWGVEGATAYLEGWYEPGSSVQLLSSQLVNACIDLNLGETDDDTTVLAFQVRHPAPVNLLIGPPQTIETEQETLRQFFAAEGKHVVCGGTTARIAAAFLGVPIKTDAETATEEIPAISHIRGMDLTTEGMITLRYVRKLIEKYSVGSLVAIELEHEKDGASRIARMLCEEATHINFFVGRAVNPDHQALAAISGDDLLDRIGLVRQLESLLREMGKTVTVQLC